MGARDDGGESFGKLTAFGHSVVAACREVMQDGSHVVAGCAAFSVISFRFATVVPLLRTSKLLHAAV